MAKKTKHSLERDEKKTNALLGIVLSLVAAAAFFILFVIIAIMALTVFDGHAPIQYAGFLVFIANYQVGIFIGFYIIDGCFFLWNLIKLITIWQKQ